MDIYNKMMPTPIKEINIQYTSLQQPVYDCLAYFDIFSYPLRANEVFDFLSQKADLKTVENTLSEMIHSGIVTLEGDFYSIAKSDIDISIRQADEKRATASLDDAKGYGRKISSFPFVKGVFISGSLSKGSLKEDGDYDFFLVIKRRRIWIAKLILKLYKVIILGNSYEYFCINYLISDENLEIEEKNIFTATELLTAIPVAGTEKLFNTLQSTNTWATSYLPNKQWRSYNEHPATKTGMSKVIQTLFDNPLGSFIDKLIMKITVFRNKIKYKNLFDKSIFNVAFKSTDQVAKVHPGNTQQFVLKLHSEKIKEFKCQS